MARGKATPVEHSFIVHQHTEVTIQRWERNHPKVKTTTKLITGNLHKVRSTCAALLLRSHHCLLCLPNSLCYQCNKEPQCVRYVQEPGKKPIQLRSDLARKVTWAKLIIYFSKYFSYMLNWCNSLAVQADKSCG